MAKYRRDYVIQKVRNGESLEGADLSYFDLSRADFFPYTSDYYLTGVDIVYANFSNTFVKNANFQHSKLTDINFSGVNLSSCDFEDATLENVDFSGANIFHIKTNGWQIKNITCTHIYQCPDDKTWSNPELREKFRRDLHPGEFEELFKHIPTIEMLFEGKIPPEAYMKLMGFLEMMRQEKPKMELDLKSMENLGRKTALKLGLSKDEFVPEAMEMLCQLVQQKGWEPKMLPILQKYGLQPVAPSGGSTFVFNNCVIHAVDSKGVKMGDTIITGDVNSNGVLQIGGSNNSAIYNNYAANKDQIDALLRRMEEIAPERKPEIEQVAADLNNGKGDGAGMASRIKEWVSLGGSVAEVASAIKDLLWP